MVNQAKNKILCMVQNKIPSQQQIKYGLGLDPQVDKLEAVARPPLLNFFI